MSVVCSVAATVLLIRVLFTLPWASPSFPRAPHSSVLLLAQQIMMCSGWGPVGQLQFSSEVSAVLHLPLGSTGKPAGSISGSYGLSPGRPQILVISLYIQFSYQPKWWALKTVPNPNCSTEVEFSACLGSAGLVRLNFYIYEWWGWGYIERVSKGHFLLDPCYKTSSDQSASPLEQDTDPNTGKVIGLPMKGR